jgi:hypothetical protein
VTRLLVLIVLAACSTEAAPPPQAAKPVAREITPRSKLPRALQAVVPQHGVYAAGGGLMSSPWRVVVDTDANTIYGGSGKQAGESSLDKLEHERTQPLTPRNRDRLVALANDAWTEPVPATRPDPIADYDEILIVADGESCFYLDGYGPIKRPLAAKTIEEMRAAAGL